MWRSVAQLPNREGATRVPGTSCPQPSPVIVDCSCTFLRVATCSLPSRPPQPRRTSACQVLLSQRFVEPNRRPCFTWMPASQHLRHLGKPPALLRGTFHCSRPRKEASGVHSFAPSELFVLPSLATKPSPHYPCYGKHLLARSSQSFIRSFSCTVRRARSQHIAMDEVLARNAEPRPRIEDLERPALDDRAYRIITLPNKLEVLLIHDPNTDKASAAMDVNVGSLSDAEDMPGIAHAVEHLLFMGTEKVCSDF